MFCRLLATFTSTLLILTIFELVGASPYSRDIKENYKTDHKIGVKIAQWTKEMKMNPEELGNYFEGDIKISNSTIRNGDVKGKRWPDGIIPYMITGTYTEEEMNNINRGINIINEKLQGCIQIVSWNQNQSNYLEITSEDDGCWSYISMIGGRQKLNLQSNNCVDTAGTLIHEFVHAMGFWHEQSREDRDKFVKINWYNILIGQEHNFEKAFRGRTKTYGIDYDYDSVMHYSAYAFAIYPNEYTIITKDKTAQNRIGQRNGFSPSDIAKIKKMYKCN